MKSNTLKHMKKELCLGNAFQTVIWTVCCLGMYFIPSYPMYVGPFYMTLCIMMTFAFRHKQPASMDVALHDTVVALLAHFVMMRFYGEIDLRGAQYGNSIFYLEWRRYKSKLLLAFAHDEI